MMGVAYITPANIKATTIALPPQLQTATRSSLLDAFKRLHPATRHYNGHNDAAQRERTWNITPLTAEAHKPNKHNQCSTLH